MSGASKRSKLKNGSLSNLHRNSHRLHVFCKRIARDTICKGKGYNFFNCYVITSWTIDPWLHDESSHPFLLDLRDQQRDCITTSSFSGLEGCKERSVVESFHGKSLFPLIGKASTKDWRNGCPYLYESGRREQCFIMNRVLEDDWMRSPQFRRPDMLDLWIRSCVQKWSGEGKRKISLLQGTNCCCWWRKPNDMVAVHQSCGLFPRGQLVKWMRFLRMRHKFERIEQWVPDSGAWNDFHPARFRLNCSAWCLACVATFSPRTDVRY